MADRGRGGARGVARGAAPQSSAKARAPGTPTPAQSASTSEKPRRESILDLSKYVNERIRVKFTGGREVTGLLKGYDQLLNLVLDDVQEVLSLPTPHIRTLGLVVLRGPLITIISPVDGSEEIANPFGNQE
ncbi:hypothetical protein AX16_001985 [Volvariella volvacea WC 439]|nr:hypothetical protein AX16_001985 [Volvariella volvacea WC 439]